MTLPSAYGWHVGQWHLLVDANQQARLPHALLFAGPAGVGKRRFAHALASYLLCSAPTAEAQACGRCRSCQLIAAQTHPDLLWLAPEDNSRAIKIDQIRGVADFVGKTSQMGGRKIAIIEPAEAMNANAANALLKNLEEPAGDTHLLLVSDAPGRLLPTIRSRCLQTIFGIPPREPSLEWLTPVVGSATVAARLLQLAGGRPLAALAMHEGDALTVRGRLRDIWQALWRDDCFSIAAKWMEFELTDILDWAAIWLQDAVRHKSGADESAIADSESLQLFMRDESGWLQAGDGASLLARLDHVNEIRRQLASGANPNKQLLLESLAAELASKRRHRI
jgi:DNA polymerase-3 subunit delta'